MVNSILLDVKKLVGLDADNNAFDTDLIIHVNSVLMIAGQLGVRLRSPYQISGVTDTWDDVILDVQKIPAIKSYMYLKTRLLFDPPQSGVLHEAMERQISEFEWRLNVQAEGGVMYGSEEDTGFDSDGDDQCDWDDG